MFRGKLRGHGASHGVSREIPVADLGKLPYHILRRARIEDRHMKGHMNQNTGDALAANLVQQRQIGLCLHFCAGIENERRVRGIGRREYGQSIPRGNARPLGQHLQGRVLRAIVVGYVPEKCPCAHGQYQHDDSRRKQQPFERDLCVRFMDTSPPISYARQAP